jgi:hypothetical protein
MIWYILLALDLMTGFEFAHRSETAQVHWFPKEWLSVFSFTWLKAFPDSLIYLPYIIPSGQIGGTERHVPLHLHRH